MRVAHSWLAAVVALASAQAGAAHFCKGAHLVLPACNRAKRRKEAATSGHADTGPQNVTTSRKMKVRQARRTFSTLSHFTATVGKLTLKQRGSKADALWGVEHYPILRHVAARTDAPCVIVEAGAHQGTLALLAAKSNCTVYAFDSVLRHLRLARSNTELNGVPEGKVTFTHRKLGDAAGSRLDEMVPLQVLCRALSRVTPPLSHEACAVS